MTVLVTGASGLLGAPTVRHLHEAGHDVIATDVRPPTGGVGGARFVELTLDEIGPAELAGVDAIVHLAAMTLGGGGTADARGILGVNVLGTDQLFRAALTAGVRSVVYASSAGVFGQPWDASPVASTGPFRPGSLYSHTKLMCEGLAAYYGHAGTGFVGIRPCFSYGLGRLDGVAGQLANLVVDAAAGRPAVLRRPYGASQHVQLMYVEDVARSIAVATHWALGRPAGAPPIVLNAPSRERLQVTEMVEIVREVTGNPAVTVEAEHPDEVLVVAEMDATESIALLGFEQDFPFARAVDHMMGLLAAAR